MSDFFVHTHQIPLAKWHKIVDWASSRAESFEIQLYLDERYPELPGSPGYGDSKFGHREDIRREVDGNSVTLRGKLQSSSGREFILHIKADLPGVGYPLYSYDLLSAKGEAILSIRDLSDVICKTDKEMTSSQFAREFNLLDREVRGI